MNGNLNQEFKFIQDVDGFFQIMTVRGEDSLSKKCLSPILESSDSRIDIVTKQCSHHDAQKWMLVKQKRRGDIPEERALPYMLFNIKTGKCLLPSGTREYGNGTTIYQMGGSISDEFKWTLDIVR